MYSAELNVPQNHVYLFKPHIHSSVAIDADAARGFCYNARMRKTWMYGKHVGMIVLALSCLTACVRLPHTGHLIVSLTDSETGCPITNATVTVRTQTKFSLSHTLESFFTKTSAVADSNGVAHAEFTFYDPEFNWWVEAPAHYSGWFGFGYGDEALGDGNVVSRSVVLTPKHNPQPMYAYGERARVYLPIKHPTTIVTNGVEVLRYKPVDFDLKEGDIVSDVPNRAGSRGEGRGTTKDLHLERYCVVTNGVKTFYGWISFAPGCGAYVVKKPQRVHFPVIYEANTNAEFLTGIPFEYSSVSGRLVRVTRLLEEDECMILRTRVETNELGEVSSCHYSKILGPVRMSGVMEFQSAIFNPRPNDPNLEFDVDSNLSDYSDGGCYP